MEQTELKIELQVKTEKLTKIESEIEKNAKEYGLWKSRYKSIDDLYSKVKDAKRWQSEKDGIILGTILTSIFGPKSRNDEIFLIFEKRNKLRGEIEDIERRILFTEGSQTKDDEQYSPACNVVMSIFPKFKKDIPLLKKHGYINKEGEKYVWLKTKQSLAEYFGCQYLKNKEEEKKNIPWKSIENLFNVDNLKNSFKSQYDKRSIDYENLLEIIKNEINNPKGE
jgi:hypothetical protein